MPATFTLKITGFSNSPDAVGRLPDGRAVFVPYTIPGETVRVEVIEERKTMARARLVDVLEPAPERLEPICAHFGPQGRCGGCHFLHLDYAAQLRAKRDVVVDHLSRIGKIAAPVVKDTRPSPTPHYYRNHVQFAQNAAGQLGFKALRSDEVIPLSECHITEPELFALYRQLDLEPLPEVDRIGLRVGAEGTPLLYFVSESAAPPAVTVELPLSVASLDPGGATLVLAGEDHLVQVVRDRPFRVSPGSFFQVNLAATELLVAEVLLALNLQGGETVLDLYCGVGLFTAFIAEHAARVLGLESAEHAVRDAEANLAEFDHVELYEAPVEETLPLLLDSFAGSPPAAVVLDPPRTGLHKVVTKTLLALAPPRIVYVSCDPATLARDAQRLTAGGYTLRFAQPVDMFPQTYHVETLAVFDLAP